MKKPTIIRYRIVRYGDSYLLQKWFARSWFWKEGWYNHHEGCWDEPSGWSSSRKHEYPTMVAAKQRLQTIVNWSLPEPDIEPVDEFSLTGEALRKRAEDGTDADKLIYADWLAANGFENNADRIRIMIGTMELAKKESALVGRH